MKKLTGMVALTLCLMLITPLALAMPGEFNILRDPDNYHSRFSSLTQDGDTLYLLQMGTIYTLKAGQSAPEPLLSGLTTYRSEDDYYAGIEKEPYYFDALLGENGVLYGLNSNTGKLFRIDAKDGAPVYSQEVQLEWDAMIITASDDYSYTCQMSNMQILDGKLYMTSQNWEKDNGAYALHVFDIKTGKRTDFTTQHISRFFPYKEGKLLVLLENENDMWDNEAQAYKPSVIASFDLATETVTELAKLSLGDYFSRGGYAYDQATDTLYFALPNRVYRMVGLGTPELCAYHLSSSTHNPLLMQNAAILGGQYVLIANDGLFVRGTDPAQLPSQTLTIGREYMDDSDRIAIAALGDIPVIYTSVNTENAQELAQRIVSGEDTVDIYHASIHYTEISRLMEKGYCYDLSAAPGLAEFTGKLFPIIQDALKQNGKLYAMPINVWSYGFSYYPNALQEIGMVPPTNFMELCEFITTWNDEYADIYSEYTPFMWENYRASLIRMAMESYADYMQATGQPLTLDTELLRSLLTAIEQVHCDQLNITADWENDPEGAQAAMDEMYNKQTLFSDYSTFTARATEDPESEWYSIAVPLPLTADVQPTIALRTEVYFVNPKSKNIDAALQYLQAYYAAVTDETLVSMSFDLKEPILSPYYESSLKSTQSSIASVKKQIETTTDPVELKALQDSLAAQEEYAARYEKYNKYLATTESIAAYHDLIQYAFVLKPSMLYSGTSDEFTQLYQRYCDGQITAEQFIQEGDAKLRMMQMENE